MSGGRGRRRAKWGDLSFSTVRTGRAAARDGEADATQAGSRASRAGGEVGDKEDLRYNTRERIHSILFFDPCTPPLLKVRRAKVVR